MCKLQLHVFFGHFWKHIYLNKMNCNREDESHCNLSPAERLYRKLLHLESTPILNLVFCFLGHQYLLFILPQYLINLIYPNDVA